MELITGLSPDGRFPIETFWTFTALRVAIRSLSLDTEVFPWFLD